MTPVTVEPISPARTSRAHPTARSWWKDALEALAWLSGVGAITFMLASGTAAINTFADLATTLGRATGIVAATMIMVQLLLASRAPFVERVVGHDRALALHGRLGRIGFVVLLVHIAMVTIGYATRSGVGFLDQAVTFTLHYGDTMFAAVAGFAVLTLVVVTSLVLVRSRWKYENWHAVHMFSYIAIGLTIPHQFLDGSTFAVGGPAWWYWFSLWGVAIVSFVVWRILKPLVSMARHGIRVAGVHGLPDGSTVITMTGRHLRSLAPQPGQFLLWRFLAKDLWGEAHPYSLSRAPRDRWLRITVKPLGDHSASLRYLRPGTRVMVEGPLGVFHHKARTARGLVLAGAGVGVTPIISMLEGAPFAPGECTVIVRASSANDAPHLDEIEALAAQRGARLYVLVGSRGPSWAPASVHATLKDLVPHIADCDVFACGPRPWTDALFEDARRSGVPDEALHSEQFAW